WRAFARDLELATDATLVVTHDAVVRCALLDIAHRPLDDFWKMRVENAAFATLDVANGRLTLREECRTEHLAGLRASTEDQAL
ncbi:MAG: histidine phosphatase family protein, partial [Candidatus Eremiobacteraeota bacterium]|nr:histidine phosphatase family protein [Candidatus Eremiobacteraeota bacterium]